VIGYNHFSAQLGKKMKSEGNDERNNDNKALVDLPVFQHMVLA
jgi:hypothetical protein